MINSRQMSTSEQNPVQIRCTFAQPIPKLDDEHKSIFPKQNWDVAYGTWNSKVFCIKQTFQSMIEARCISLQLNYNKLDTIPKQILHINYTNLNKLDLKDNLITNIQALSFLKAPCLTEINLTCNKITQLKPLSKHSFCKLSKLILNKNPTKQFITENRLLINPHTQQFPSERHYDEQYISQDISSWAKLHILKQLKPSIIFQLFKVYASIARIKQRKTLNSLLRKGNQKHDPKPFLAQLDPDMLHLFD